MSRVDYCNSLLCDIQNKLLNLIQWNQNYAAQVIHRLHQFSHITSALATLCCTLVPWSTGSISKAHRWFIKAPAAYILDLLQPYPDGKAHMAHMGPIWGRQDPGGPHVGPLNFAITVQSTQKLRSAGMLLISQPPWALSQTWFNLNPSMDK